jgi:hypothetical protein
MSLAVLADHMASKGRGPDSMLIHMSPREVQGLQALAENHGGSLTINPETGLPEAGFLDKLLPAIIGVGISYFTGLDPKTAGMIVGGIETARTGDIGKGISAGLGAYGGASLTAGLTSTGDSLLSQEPTSLAANEAAKLAGEEAVRNGIANNFTPEMLEAARMEAIETAGNNTARISASPFENLKAGAESAAKNPMQYLKANAMPLAAAFGPAIFAGQNAQNNMPKTTTGMIRPYSFDPYSGTYTSGNPYQATPTRGADGGLMGMDDGGYSPGQLDFTQKSEPVVRMAGGGKVERFAIGRLVEGGPLTGGAGLDMNNDIYKYFSDPATQALLSSGNDAAIAAKMQEKDWTAAQIAKATGTQNQQADYERRFAQAVNTPTTDATEFLAATTDVGLQNQGLATALQNSGLSAAGQYASTHGLADTGGITGTNFYNQIGYTAGALPGDKGGLEGLYANINYSAKGLQDQINAGKITVAEAQRLADAEMKRVGVSGTDVKNATGLDLANLFKDKPIVADVVCGPGYKKSIDGKTCVPDTTVITQETQCPTGFHYDPVAKACVKNLDATQTTSTNVTTPTSISTATSTALPVGVSGAGITTINPNGTITTRPDLTLGMSTVRDAYEKGGGSLGYTSPTFASLKAVEDKYPLRGGSKQSYDFLTGKTDYDPKPYTKTGELMKPYGESVLGIPANSSKKMYIFKDGKYEVNPAYAIPTYDKDGKKSYNLTNADVKTFMDKKPSTDAFYTWATTNNLTPEQIAQASERPINEISKLFTGAKDLVGDDGKIDQTKVDEKATKDIETNWDEAAYLAANPSVAEELRTGKSASGKPVLFTSGYDHYLKYGKDQGWKPTVKKAAGGGLAAMARGNMAQQFNLGDYSDGGRLLRGPGDGVSDSIPASIGGKRPARLADGEFVVPARIVSELGNGSTEAGARKLYAMMDRIQSARGSTVGKGRVAKNSRAEKYLPA